MREINVDTSPAPLTACARVYRRCRSPAECAEKGVLNPLKYLLRRQNRTHLSGSCLHKAGQFPHFLALSHLLVSVDQVRYRD